MRSLINMSIALTNITHARNQSMLYFQRIDGNITGLSATIVNSSLLSNGSVIGIDSVAGGGGLYSSNITIDSVHQITSVSFSGYVMVLLTGIPMIGSGVYVSVSRCSLGGFVNASSGASIIAIQSSLVSGGSLLSQRLFTHHTHRPCRRRAKCSNRHLSCQLFRYRWGRVSDQARHIRSLNAPDDYRSLRI